MSKEKLVKLVDVLKNLTTWTSIAAVIPSVDENYVNDRFGLRDATRHAVGGDVYECLAECFGISVSDAQYLFSPKSYGTGANGPRAIITRVEMYLTQLT